MESSTFVDFLGTSIFVYTPASETDQIMLESMLNNVRHERCQAVAIAAGGRCVIITFLKKKSETCTK